jgi:glyoxylase-like metal-dependent hydrolase (beta-lactamase superfamily II)
MALDFETAFEPRHGEAVEIAPGIARVTAPNAGPFTFHGTNTYLVGTGELAVIDPGPDEPSHLAALLRAIGERPVGAILVSHTHRDHSPLSRALARQTGAPILGAGPHRAARPLNIGETNPLDASADTDHAPDRLMADGDVAEGEGWRLRAVATPGHTANHLAFALEGTGTLFSADHVMAWSTTIVAPPDGSMADYMASLERLLARDDRIYFPGHGGPVRNPPAFVRGLKAHRKLRERAVLERVLTGDRLIPQIVAAIYRDTDPRLHAAAGLSVLAHLEDLCARGAIRCDGAPAIDAEYTPG